jgi:HSP20 family protein
MQKDLSRLFGEFGTMAPRGGSRASVYPALNVYHDGESFIVRAEAPGVNPKSLDVEVTGDTLLLRGERKLPELAEGASYHRRECDYGRFCRSFSLPDRVDSSNVVASCRDGILEIRLPHAEETRARKVAVKAK